MTDKQILEKAQEISNELTLDVEQLEGDVCIHVTIENFQDGIIIHSYDLKHWDEIQAFLARIENEASYCLHNPYFCSFYEDFYVKVGYRSWEEKKPAIPLDIFDR